jgi:hypothetical protein
MKRRNKKLILTMMKMYVKWRRRRELRKKRVKRRR